MHTARDLTDYLSRFLGDTPQGSGLFFAKEAINSALRELWSHFNWSYTYFAGRIATVAAYSTGTVTYTHTGGATCERQLTLSSGTWPTWAAAGVVYIANTAYTVDERRSSTVLSLTSASNPGSDLAAGTTYTIYREKYPLPADFKASGKLTLANNVGELEYIHPGDWLRLVRNFATTSTPTMYCILGNPQTPGNMEIAFYPFVDQVRQIDMLYQRRPLPIINWDYHDGTVSITTGTATIAGSATTFTSRMAGQNVSLRLSLDATNLPTGLSDTSPYAEELVVKEFTSSTALRLASNAGATYSGVKYMISDFVDVEDGAMYTALQRCAEWQINVMKQVPADKQELSRQNWLTALELAKAADSRNFSPRGAGNMPYMQRRARMPLAADS